MNGNPKDAENGLAESSEEIDRKVRVPVPFDGLEEIRSPSVWERVVSSAHGSGAAMLLIAIVGVATTRTATWQGLIGGVSAAGMILFLATKYCRRGDEDATTCKEEGEDSS